MRFSLRAKLVLLSLLLLLIPLLGLRLNASLKANLIASQKEALELTALAVSAALTDRADLFVQEQFHALRPDRDLYLYELSSRIRLDGSVQDWLPEFDGAETFGRDNLLTEPEHFTPASLGFRHLATLQGDYLYALFDVTDDRVVYRAREMLSVVRSDHLRITIADDASQRRYVVPSYEPGWVIGFFIPDDPDRYPTVEKRINGKWRQTSGGYRLEIRIHQDLLGTRLAFAVADVDDAQSGRIEAVIGTASIDEAGDEPGWLLSTSTKIEAILTALDRPEARIRVVDQNRRVRAEVGGLREPAVSRPAADRLLDRATASLHELFAPLFRLFTTAVSTDIEETARQPTAVDLDGIEDGLAGTGSIAGYRIEDGAVEVLAAIAPVHDGEEVVAAVVVEQTTNSILSLSNRLIEETLLVSLLAFLVGGGALFLFGFVVSSRIRRLRDEADASLSEDGVITSAITKTGARDEIGDLGRTLAAMLAQLREQIDYREKMADNLEHEMRTPLAGVAASLKNIEAELDDRHGRIRGYLDGAVSNTRRLNELLSTIREAVSLKDALAHDELRVVDLAEAVPKWLEANWRKAFPEVDFQYAPEVRSAPVAIDDVRILQALDKLVENAVSYHRRTTPVEIALGRRDDRFFLKVTNLGPAIDPRVRLQMFGYMVSTRVSSDERPHLGLGLYVARTIVEHHGGRLSGADLADGREGVEFTVELPAG